jgi:hypothetical protein
MPFLRLPQGYRNRQKSVVPTGAERSEAQWSNCIVVGQAATVT